MEEVTAYKCGFCGKLYKVKGTCIRHEKYCRSNPDNHHACFNCKNLDVSSYTNDNDIHHREFRCSVHNKSMYSYIAERRSMDVINQKGIEKMPLECAERNPLTPEDDNYWF